MFNFLPTGVPIWPGLFLSFIGYGLVGNIIESVYLAIVREVKKIPLGDRRLSHAFLHLPFRPIYGFGGVIVQLLLAPIASGVVWWQVFLICTISLSLFEFFSGELLKLIFKKNYWWDYTHEKFNFDGQTCLKMALLFGVCGMSAFYIFQPLFNRILVEVDLQILNWVTWILLALIVIDFIHSSSEHWRTSQPLRLLSQLQNPRGKRSRGKRSRKANKTSYRSSSSAR